MFSGWYPAISVQILGPESYARIKDKAILYGFNKAGLIAYSEILDLYAYYEGERVKAAGIVRIVGIVFDPTGNIVQEWENIYDEDSGALAGTRNYAYREHLKNDEKHQKMPARLQELRAKRTEPPTRESQSIQPNP